MDIKQCFLTKNDCYKAGKYITPKGIMIHSTGANNPYLRRYVQPNDGILGVNQYQNDWNRPGVAKCVHAFIGKDNKGTVRIYQTLPWNMRGWHAGSTANNTHISFEICEDDLKNKEYAQEVLELATDLCAYLCNLFNLKASDVISHYEGYQRGIASQHNDINHWISRYNITMQDIRDVIATKLNNERYSEYLKVDNKLYIIKVPVENFKILSWNNYKKTTKVKNYCSGGYFSSGKNTTEAMGNLVIDGKVISETSHTYGNLSGHKLHTLCVDNDNKISCIVTDHLEPNKYKYAISGLPVTLDYNDVSWSKVCKPQGWTGGELRPTKHICVGIGPEPDYIYIVGIETTVNNSASAITQIWQRLKQFDLQTVLKLDGGGSTVIDIDGTNVFVTPENRKINNLLLY